MKGMLQVSTGDMLRPDPCWNRTTGNKSFNLPDPVEVIGITVAKSQTGMMLAVRSIGGIIIHLDRGWFTENLTSTERSL